MVNKYDQFWTRIKVSVLVAVWLSLGRQKAFAHSKLRAQQTKGRISSKSRLMGQWVYWGYLQGHRKLRYCKILWASHREHKQVKRRVHWSAPLDDMPTAIHHGIPIPWSTFHFLYNLERRGAWGSQVQVWALGTTDLSSLSLREWKWARPPESLMWVVTASLI